MLKVLIMTGGESKYHEVLAAGSTFQRFLLARDIHVQITQDFSILTREESEKYDLFLFYTHDKQLTREEQAGLEKKVRQGKGYLPIHAASVISKPDQEQHLKLVGNRFIKHDPL
ncbi:MAG: ThuA domain-containing protein, partial [Halanaerobiales bacterium]